MNKRKYFVRYSFGKGEFARYFASLKDVENYFSGSFGSLLTFFKLYGFEGVLCELHNTNFKYFLSFRRNGSIYFVNNNRYV